MASERQRRNIARLLRPRSIAFIGGKELEIPIDSCRRIGFAGEMWVVNPKRDRLAGLSCHASLEDLPEAPDAAFIAVNAALTPGVVRDLARLGAGGAVCYAAGFAELGDEGRAYQRELVEAAGDLAVLGPNCYGLLNYLDGAALWADAHGGEHLGEGIAIVSQSGNISLNLTMTERSVPLAQVIAVGNQAVLGPGDFIEPLLDDPRIKAIGLYMEGLDDVGKFSEAAAQALEKGVPIVALKVGRSATATRITASHTASLAGEDALYDALFERLGIIRVPSLTAWMETLKFLSLHGPLPGGRLGVLTCSGGDAALLADLAEREGLTLPPLTKIQSEAIRNHVTRITTVSNPLDYNTAIWGQRDKLESCFAAVMSEGVDATVLVIDYARQELPGIEGWHEAVEALISASKTTGCLGLAVATFPELLPSETRRRLIEAGLVPLQGLEDAIIALGRAHWLHGRRQEVLSAGSVSHLVLPTVKPLPRNDAALDEWRSKQALSACGLTTPQSALVAGTDAPAAAKRVGFPVVVKAVGAHLHHKSDVGAVALGLLDEAAVAAAIDRMGDLADRFLIERMVPGAVAEVIVGVKRDPSLGLALVLGSGGVLTNLVEDAARLLLPIDRNAIDRALAGTKVDRLITGYRGGAKGDREALLDAVEAIAHYAESERDRLIELDVNPILVLPEGNGVVAVDAMVRLAGMETGEKVA